MMWEVHYIKTVESDNFFDAVEKVKENFDDIEEVVSVCPFMEEDMIPNE